MTKEKDPFERQMLRDLNKISYLKKLEYIIVEEGKRLLYSQKVSFLLVSSKDMSKYDSKHPDLQNMTWHQIGLKNLFDKKLINTFQYQLLITMKQVYIY